MLCVHNAPLFVGTRFRAAVCIYYSMSLINHVCLRRTASTIFALCCIHMKVKDHNLAGSWRQFDKLLIAQSIAESSGKTAEAISRVRAGDNDLGSTHPIRPNVAKQHEFQPIVTEHDRYQLILYALGGNGIAKSVFRANFLNYLDVCLFLTVGCSTTQKDHLKFLFESNQDFSALPSYGVIPPFGSMGQLTSVEGLDINPAMVKLMRRSSRMFCKPNTRLSG